MKKKAILTVAVLLIVAGLIIADGVIFRIVASKAESVPGWLTLEVKAMDTGAIGVVLRMAPREQVGTYGVKLLCDKGPGRGTRVPVAITKTRVGFETFFSIPRSFAVEARIMIDEVLKHADGGNMYEIDLGTYVEQLEKRPANKSLRGTP